jgi:hypothetical protein
MNIEGLCIVFEWTVFASDWPTQWDDVAQKQFAACVTDIIKYTTV